MLTPVTDCLLQRRVLGLICCEFQSGASLAWKNECDTCHSRNDKGSYRSSFWHQSEFISAIWYFQKTANATAELGLRFQALAWGTQSRYSHPDVKHIGWSHLAHSSASLIAYSAVQCSCHHCCEGYVTCESSFSRNYLYFTMSEAWNEGLYMCLLISI